MPRYFHKRFRDDRDYGDSHISHKVNFKGGRNNGGKFNKDFSAPLKNHLEDDCNMNFDFDSGRKFRRGGGKKARGQSRPSGSYRRSSLFESPIGWYKVVIPYGEKYEKKFLQKLLLDNVAPLDFSPVAWRTEGSFVIFFIDDYKLAVKLFGLDHQVQFPDGYKLQINVSPGSPNLDLSSKVKEAMKVAMANRYNAATKALDLSRFHCAPEVQESYCALLKPQILLAVLEIIEQNIPDLEAISLNNNRLIHFEPVKNSIKKLSNVKILHLANNRIKDLASLEPFSSLPIVDLLLDGNPLCNKFKDQDIYISEVRKRFPKCMKLDGTDLPPPIIFDLNDETVIPDTKQTFLCSAEGESIVRQFLDQYFTYYDDEDRQPLLDAYHENAAFSLTACPYFTTSKDKSAWLNWYYTENRNLLKLVDRDRRLKLLKRGKYAIITFLKDMPATKHDKQSFTVDLTLFMPQLISLTITGIFKELRTGHKRPPIRYFYRTMVIVPSGSGFCIANDQIHITNASPEQIQGAFKKPSLPPAPSSGIAAPPSTPEASPIVVPVAVVNNDAIREEMIVQLSIKTGMNTKFSIDCLEGNNWNFERALVTFQTFQSEGKIPPEAFIK